MKNRRRGPDVVVKIVNTISMVSWAILFGVMLFFSLAKPKLQGFQSGMQMVTGGWDQQWLDMVLYLLIFQVFVCGVGLSFNALRLRRRSDKLSTSLIVFAGISILGIVIHTISF